jgi:hypothetical protein
METEVDSSGSDDDTASDTHEHFSLGAQQGEPGLRQKSYLEVLHQQQNSAGARSSSTPDQHQIDDVSQLFTQNGWAVKKAKRNGKRARKQQAAEQFS